MSKRIVLLGHPVKQSLSPAFQQAAFDHVGLPVRYEVMDVPRRNSPPPWPHFAQMRT